MLERNVEPSIELGGYSTTVLLLFLSSGLLASEFVEDGADREQHEKEQVRSCEGILE